MKNKLLMLAGVCWILVILALSASAQAAIFLTPSNPPPTVKLQWDPSSSTNVAGYNIYYGVSPRAYTNRTSVGNITNATITLPARGPLFYFTATAFTAAGLESDYCNEVSYAAPSIAPPGTLRTNAVQLAMSIEKAPKATGPWSLYATLGTDVTAPGFFRSVVQITGGDNTPDPLPPIPGGP